MKKPAIVVLTCFVAVVGIIVTSWAAEQGKRKTPEQKAWEEVDSLDKESLEGFLKRFPDGELAKQAKVAVELQDELASIKKGKAKGRFTISLAVLGDRWAGWQQRNPNKGVVGYYAKKGATFNTLGWFSPLPLSGGKTPGRGTISFDAYGVLTSPTGDGSVIAFRTSGLKFELFKGIVFETPGDEPMYFGVVKGKGLVHLKGIGKVTLPDGKTIELSSEKAEVRKDEIETIQGKVAGVSMQTTSGPGPNLFEPTADLSHDPKSTAIITLQGKTAHKFHILTSRKNGIRRRIR